MAEIVSTFSKSMDKINIDFSKKIIDEVNWEIADEQAKIISENITEALSFLDGIMFFGEINNQYFEKEKIENEITDGVEKLFFLVSGIGKDNRGVGPDSRGVFRRRALTPLTLVPSRVSNSSSNPTKISMLSLLEEAQQAFIYGTPFASLTLLRAILEIIFRDHYKIEGKDLADRINRGSSLLPKGVYPNDLHILRMEANSLLHDSGAARNLGELTDIENIETKISNHLNNIRKLIENL